jgi:integrase/recombinase XerD
VINYTPVARSFLSERFPKGALRLQKITAAHITAFVQRQATSVTSERAQLVVTALRSFLRYLFLRGLAAIDLATCVPTIATWSLSNLPRFLAGEQIQKILASCDKETSIGKRDYALLLLLARLGLRACEAVALALDDFDWRLVVEYLESKRLTGLRDQSIEDSLCGKPDSCCPYLLRVWASRNCTRR